MQRSECVHCNRRILSPKTPRYCPGCGKRGKWNHLEYLGVPAEVANRPDPKNIEAIAGVRPQSVTIGCILMFINAGFLLLGFLTLVIIVVGFTGMIAAMGPFFAASAASFFGAFLLIAFAILGLPGGLALAAGLGTWKGKPWGPLFAIILAGIFLFGDISYLGYSVWPIFDLGDLISGLAGLALDIAMVYFLTRPDARQWYAGLKVAQQKAQEMANEQAATPAPSAPTAA